MDSFRSAQEPVTGFTKGEELVEQLRDYQLLKWGSVPMDLIT
jgi:hypothetical protein